MATRRRTPAPRLRTRAPRRRSAGPHLDLRISPELTRSLVGIVLLVVGAVTLIALFLPLWSGMAIGSALAARAGSRTAQPKAGATGL